MEKQIFSEYVYLTGDKTAMDYFLKKKQEKRISCEIERLKYPEVIRGYNRYLLLVRDFLKSLGLKTSIENAIAISYLIRYGYLSKDKVFRAEETEDELEARYGMTIVKGLGCCRNFSDVGKDLISLLDYYSKKLYCYLPNISLPKSAYMKQANHVINLIEYDGVKYGIDLDHGCELYHFKDCFTLEKISLTDRGKIRFKPYYEIITGEGTLESIHKELEEFELESKKHHLSPLIYEQDIKPDTIHFMACRKKELEDFHNETNDIKQQIVMSLTK